MNSENQDLDYLKSLTMLYVEDDENTRKQFCEFLSYCSGVLIKANNGEEGLQAYLLHKPDIITDIRMPIMDGLLDNCCPGLRDIC